MSMLNRRLQVLIDEARWRRLEAESERRRVPVSVLVRDAIDRAYGGVTLDDRQAAWEFLKSQPPGPVPAAVEDVKALIRAQSGFSAAS